MILYQTPEHKHNLHIVGDIKVNGEYCGRLFMCTTCGHELIIHGVLPKEIQDVMAATLKDLPRGFLGGGLLGLNYGEKKTK